MHHARSSRARRVAMPFAAVLVVLAAVPWVARAASPSPTPATPAGMTMEARALVQGHARTGSWMAIRVDLANDGPAFAGELRLVGGPPAFPIVATLLASAAVVLQYAVRRLVAGDDVE